MYLDKGSLGKFLKQGIVSRQQLSLLFDAMLVDIVIHGDLLCPWCFLQKKSLEAAMERYQALHPEIEFDVSWKPFLLYPTLRRGMLPADDNTPSFPPAYTRS